jgi:hypothetical protein
MTVDEMIAKLSVLDPSHTVHAYEGEGGCWVIVHDADRREVAAWNVEPA